jgi:hypothetical protein
MWFIYLQAKALAEKNERDMQVQREQAERDVSANAFHIRIILIMLALVHINTHSLKTVYIIFFLEYAGGAAYH